MTRMQFDEGKGQAGEVGARVLLPVCVCGAGLNESTRPGGPVVPPCPTCGGSPPRAVGPERQERRHLQDFLSAFV